MTETSDIQEKQQQLDSLRRQVASLESEVASSRLSDQWNYDKFYSTYYATVGFVYGGIAAMASLLLNVIAAPIAGKHPLEIIRVYLTFPLGERALGLTSGEKSQYVINDGVILALGCCLYIGTGMVLGIVFHWVICRLALNKPLVTRLAVGTVLAVVVWIVNFYLILAWLQPLLFRGSWITDNSILPWWVALGTHLVFGWTMALMAPLGAFVPYTRPTDQPA
ncbi:MAG: hypothetical protein R3C19_10625 [Planctomycetaceae bacterium]